MYVCKYVCMYVYTHIYICIISINESSPASDRQPHMLQGTAATCRREAPRVFARTLRGAGHRYIALAEGKQGEIKT